MEKSVNALTEHEVFVRELIALYKQKPQLWQQKHPDYRNRAERADAFEALIKKTQEYYPEADEDFVRTKIDSMRASFRKERKKVLASKENCNNPDEVHKPSLWYYELLLFTAGEEAETEANGKNAKPEDILAVTNPADGNSVKIPFWSREHSAILINFYKSHPCLYSAAHPHYRNKRRRIEAVKKITDKLMDTTGKYFHTEDVRRKISLIRGQFLHEYKKIKNSESKGDIYKPTLWCFEMLSFLKEEYSNDNRGIKKIENQMKLRRRKRKNSSSEESDEDMDIKKESDSSLSSESVQMETSLETNHVPEDEDIYDTIGKNLAHKLREMTENQRNIANKIIREVLYHGQMEHLSIKSRFSINGT